MESFLKHYYYLLASLLIALYGIINLYCSTKLSVTGDESNYYQYGVNILKGNSQKKLVNGIPAFNSQMPMMAVNAIPRAFLQIQSPSERHNIQQTLTDITNARFFSVLSAIMLALYILVWSTALYGAPAGIFSLLLYLLCPNIMAHSQMVSTDVYSFLLCTATCYHAWKYAGSNDIKQLFLLALMLGIGQVSKQSLLLLYPVVIVFLLVRLSGLNGSQMKKTGILVKELVVIGVVSLLVINAGFLLHGTGQPLKKYQFVSTQFNALQQRFSIIENIPVPLPTPYIAGFDYVAFNTETPPGINGKSSYGAGHFLGKPVTGKRIWNYYLVCGLYKLPVSLLIFILTAALVYWKYRKHFKFLSDEIYLLLPAVFIVSIFCWYNTMYLGIKNILMVLPLLFVFCGSLLPFFLQGKKWYGQFILGALLLVEVITVFSYFPHFLPYTNEFIVNKKNAYKILGDNNIYFQEGWKMAEAYLDKNPDIQWEPVQPTHGKVMVSLEQYLDFWHEKKLQWLRNLQLEPSGHYHSQYLIFDVP